MVRKVFHFKIKYAVSTIFDIWPSKTVCMRVCVCVWWKLKIAKFRSSEARSNLGKSCKRFTNITQRVCMQINLVRWYTYNSRITIYYLANHRIYAYDWSVRAIISNFHVQINSCRTYQMYACLAGMLDIHHLNVHYEQWLYIQFSLPLSK